MTLEEWVRASLGETLPPLRRPPPVRLFAHQEQGARRMLALLRRFGAALLFDDVGMGKSFTATAVAREWRGPIAATVPAPLLPTWRATLARFGVEAELVSHDSLGALASLGRGSLLIVDEAHRFRNPATLRHRRLEERFSSSLLLVTATPLCNGLGDIRSLVRLAFADDALKGYGVPSIEAAFETEDPAAIRSMLSLIAVRREPGGDLVFPDNTRRVVRFSLGTAGEKIARALAELGVPLSGEAALLRSHLRARLESSPEALRDSLERQKRFYRRAREKLADGFVLRRADFASLFEKEEANLFQELLFPEAFLPKANSEASVGRALESELKRIDDLLARLTDCGSEKFERLDTVVREISLPAIIFTRAIATAKRLFSLFAGRLRTGVASSRGAIDPRGVDVELDALLRAFRARQIDLLILTDLASEGLDLQAAATIVHFDLPWTAVKLDQRNGRAIRIGQTRGSVASIYFVPASTRQQTPLRFVARKERLANRYLQPDPFGPFTSGEGCTRMRAAAIGDSVVILESGAVFRLDGAALTADPCSLRALAGVDVRPLESFTLRWDECRIGALAMPSRIERASPQAALLRTLPPEAIARVLPLLNRRYRSGTERALGELAANGFLPPEAIESLLTSEPRCDVSDEENGVDRAPAQRAV
ncbi:MAG TPA: helicase-related protein [Thermoanaerobaculia bacterium]|nr:helicase-related protein [Thermoanaerobaculia bacterium]